MLWVSLCGLWKAPKEKKFVLSGKFGCFTFLVFKNDKKGNVNAPDYRLSFGIDCNYVPKLSQDITEEVEPLVEEEEDLPY